MSTNKGCAPGKSSLIGLGSACDYDGCAILQGTSIQLFPGGANPLPILPDKMTIFLLFITSFDSATNIEITKKLLKRFF